MKTAVKILFKNKNIEITKIINSSHNFPVHNHNCICTGLINSGLKFLSFKNEKLKLKKNDLFIIPALKAHSCINEKNTYTIVSFSSISQLKKSLNNIKIKKIINDEKLRKLLKNIFNTKKIITKYNNDYVLKAIDYINNNYMYPLSINYLAKICCVSPYHLLHLFKKATGISLHQYIIQKRIKFSLKETEKYNKIVNLALDCGFFDQSHFIRCFKKHVGLTPGLFFNSLKAL